MARKNVVKTVCFHLEWYVNPFAQSINYLVSSACIFHSFPHLLKFFAFFFSSFFVLFTYFLLLSIPSLSTGIVSLRFQAGGRIEPGNQGLVCSVILCNLSTLLFWKKLMVFDNQIVRWLATRRKDNIHALACKLNNIDCDLLITSRREGKSRVWQCFEWSIDGYL